LRFRWHFVTAVFAGLVLSGHLRDYLKVDVGWWPTIALSTEFGPWSHPLNLIMCLFVFAAIPILQFIKWARPESSQRLRIAQIIIWWAFWLLFGLAGRFGTWRGP